MEDAAPAPEPTPAEAPGRRSNTVWIVLALVVALAVPFFYVFGGNILKLVRGGNDCDTPAENLEATGR